MRAHGAVVSLLLLVLVVPVAAAVPGDVLYEAHVDAAAGRLGTAYGALSNLSPRGLGLDPVERDSPWTHYIDVTDRPGAWIAVVAQDHSGLGVWTVMTFRGEPGMDSPVCIDPHDEQGYLEDDLGIAYVSDICQVPARAHTMYLRIEQGVDVDLQVVEVEAPGHDPNVPLVGTGHIAAAPFFLGTVWTHGFGYSGDYGLLADYPDALPSHDTAFAFRLPVEGRTGQTLGVEVDDQGGVGYILRMQFYRADLYPVDADCVYGSDGPFEDTPQTVFRFSETCVVPADAAHVTVYADHGIDLEVAVMSDLAG